MGKNEEKTENGKWLPKQPIIESQVKTSNDGKWVIHRTVITDIRSASYMEKVLATAAEKEEESEQDSSSLDDPLKYLPGKLHEVEARYFFGL